MSNSLAGLRGKAGKVPAVDGERGGTGACRLPAQRVLPLASGAQPASEDLPGRVLCRESGGKGMEALVADTTVSGPQDIDESPCIEVKGPGQQIGPWRIEILSEQL